MSTPVPFELERTRWMRFGGGTFLQPVLVFVAVVWLVFVVRNGEPLLLVISVVALALWVPGARAWIRVDETGIHRRCYLRHDIAWTDIRSIELKTVSLSMNSVRRGFWVHRSRGRQWLAPATGNTKYNERFARDLIAAARARGIAVDTSGWGGFEDRPSSS